MGMFSQTSDSITVRNLMSMPILHYHMSNIQIPDDGKMYHVHRIASRPEDKSHKNSSSRRHITHRIDKQSLPNARKKDHMWVLRMRMCV